MISSAESHGKIPQIWVQQVRVSRQVRSFQNSVPGPSKDGVHLFVRLARSSGDPAEFMFGLPETGTR